MQQTYTKIQTQAHTHKHQKNEWITNVTKVNALKLKWQHWKYVKIEVHVVIKIVSPQVHKSIIRKSSLQQRYGNRYDSKQSGRESLDIHYHVMEAAQKKQNRAKNFSQTWD